MSNFVRIKEQLTKGTGLPKFKPNTLVSTEMTKLLNTQVKNEFYSANLYLSMCAWCKDYALNGMAHWLEKQFEEEQSHGKKFLEYINDRNAKVVFQSIDAPPSDFMSPLDLWQQVYDHEIVVSDSLDAITAQAEKEKDRTTLFFMQWFLLEQVEELSKAYDIVQRLMIAKDDPAALLHIDNELSSR